LDEIKEGDLREDGATDWNSSEREKLSQVWGIHEELWVAMASWDHFR
jgi:hypothetical protein